MIAFTSDIDWAPEEVIEDMLNIFEHFQIPCTLFCTHESPVIKKCNKDLFEIAIHPNFNPLLEGKIKSNANVIIDELLRIYPEAIGIRSHSMTQSSKLLELFKNKGLVYDSNQFFPYNFSIKPYKCWTGLIRIPYNWEDDIHFTYNKSYNYKIFKKYSNENFYILDFHPIHVFINTEKSSRYTLARKYYHKAQKLLRYRNTKTPGVRDFLLKTLAEAKNNSLQCNLLREWAES